MKIIFKLNFKDYPLSELQQEIKLNNIKLIVFFLLNLHGDKSFDKLSFNILLNSKLIPFLLFINPSSKTLGQISSCIVRRIV